MNLNDTFKIQVKPRRCEAFVKIEIPCKKFGPIAVHRAICETETRAVTSYYDGYSLSHIESGCSVSFNKMTGIRKAIATAKTMADWSAWQTIETETSPDHGITLKRTPEAERLVKSAADLVGAW